MVLLVSGDTALNLDNMVSMDVMPAVEDEEGGKGKSKYLLSFAFAGNIRMSLSTPKNTKKSCVGLRDYILREILRHDKGKDSVIIDVRSYKG